METKQAIPSDGSNRKFYRIVWNGRQAIKILPSLQEHGAREAKAFFLIGQHLFSKGVPVPEIYHFDDRTGTMIVEDLGDMKLQDITGQLLANGYDIQVFNLYSQVLDLLVTMQVEGAKGFDTDWCWQTGYYDSKLARENEVSYFLNAFASDFLGLSFTSKVESELLELADTVNQLKYRYFFMHRDFQSRNIMIFRNEPRILDFQAGRLGPLAYDLASLVYDPYVHLPDELRQRCIAHYLTSLRERGLKDAADEVAYSLKPISCLRLMQALGAYGFLTKHKNKSFFTRFMVPAFTRLSKLIEGIASDKNGQKFTLDETIKFLDKMAAALETLEK